MISIDRQYRNFEAKASEDNYVIEGYAVTFNQPTVMYEIDGIQYKEEIDRNAFTNAEIGDVVLNFNHQGKPMARTRNNSLTLNVDDFGLKIKADLSGSEEARRTYEEVKNGLLDKMSFAFNINEEEYNSKERMRRITGIKRLFDVSIVDLPAYDTTSVYARSYYEDKAKNDVLIARKNDLLKRRNELKVITK